MNDKRIINNNKEEINIIENNEEFYPLNPEDIPRQSYSFTSSLYNNRNNRHDPFQRKYIGQFVLSEKLGQGTFGIVVLATHQITGEKVAVKILEKERILQEADKTRIEREIKILKNLRHNNIVHLYDIKETPSSLYIIMEYISGKELFDYIISKKHLSELESCNFYQQIISGIEYLGKIKVVHRDLKPENLLLDENKNIKFVDFGLSNIYPNNELLITACGSPCYAAPEMINGEPYIGLRVDIWSSGIVLFAMLCGYLPFEDSDNEILYKKITEGKFKTPKYLSDCCKDFLHRILNINPEQRYTIDQIKNHPWFNIINPKLTMSEGLLLHMYIVPIDEKIIDEMVNKLKFNGEEVRANLIANNHNHTTTTYYLLLKKKLREGKKSICDMKSKEFLNYLKNPINLLSAYGYNLELIIQMRNKKIKEIFDIYNFDNIIIYDKGLSLRTKSGANMNHKTLNNLNNQKNSEDKFLEITNNNINEIKTIFHKKKNDLLKRIKYDKKFKTKEKFYASNKIRNNQNKGNKINKNKDNKKNKKKDLTKESMSFNFFSNSNKIINNINNNDLKSTKKIENKKKNKLFFIKKEIKKEHDFSITKVNQKYEVKKEDKLKNEIKKEKEGEYSFDNNFEKRIGNKNKQKINKKVQVKSKRTITNNFEEKKMTEKSNNFKTITERGNKELINDKKDLKNLLEKHFTIKSKKENKTFRPLKDNTEINISKLDNKNKNNKTIDYNDNNNKDKYIKISELMMRMKKRTMKNIQENLKGTKEMSYKNLTKENFYYLQTEKERIKILNTTNDNKNSGIKEYNSKVNFEEKKKVNFSANNSTKLVKNLLKINSFKLNENNEIKIKKAIKNDKLANNERKTREKKEINKRAYNRKGFIDTSVSFDKSHEGQRIRDTTKPKKILNIQSEMKTINIKIKNKKQIKNNFLSHYSKNNEKDSDSNKSENKKIKNLEEIKRKEKDNKYLELKSKNKKFIGFKLDKENKINNNLNIEQEKDMLQIKKSFNCKNNDRNIIKRNKFEITNYTTKIYTNINKNNIEEYNTIAHDDFSFSNKSKNEKTGKISKKIKSLNTQGNFFKKLEIKKNHIHNSLNESKKNMFIKKINSSLNDKIKSFNHKDKYNSNEDIFYQTYINKNNKKIFQFSVNNKKTIEDCENDTKDDIFKPFDLDFLFIKNGNYIKEIISKEIKLKKYKSKIKKYSFLIYKNDNQIELNICKIGNNIYNIRVMKKRGNYQNCKNIIKSIVYKLK